MYLAPGAKRSARAPLGFTSFAVAALALASIRCAPQRALPAAATVPASPGGQQAAIERSEICVGSAVASAGELADTLYYRAATLPDGRLVVGYFAFFSEERPWGNNWLTWTLLPALAIDMVYSHGLLVAPGVQRLASGPGDVEGFRVTYAVRPDGSLRLEEAIADDGSHAPVHLAAADALALDPARPTFYSTVWSHQLGGRGVRSMSELAYVRCYGPARIRRLPDAVADDYALAHRAMPAHVEALGGRPLGAGGSAQAKAKTAQPPL